MLSKSDIIDSAVKLMVEGKRDSGDDEDYRRRGERLKNHADWVEKHKITNVKPGDKIDALDTEYIWCKAVVELKI